MRKVPISLSIAVIAIVLGLHLTNPSARSLQGAGAEPIFGDPAPDPQDWIPDLGQWAAAVESEPPSLHGDWEEGGFEPSVAEGGSEAYWETYQVTGLPSCRSYRKFGNRGFIAVQSNPSIMGNVQWGASMYQWWDNWGVWLWKTSKNGHLLHHNLNQPLKSWYPPHGSYSAPDTWPGDIFSVSVVHAYFAWMPYCGWLFSHPEHAHGTLTCIVP